MTCSFRCGLLLRLLISSVVLTSCATFGFADDLKRVGYFGVRVVEVPDEMRKQLNLAPGFGILVADVYGGASAEAAGILSQDIILKFNDVLIGEVATFINLARRTRGGDKVQLSLLRAGHRLTKEVLVKP